MPASKDDGHFYSFRWGFLGRYIQNDLLDVRRNNAEVRRSMFNTSLGELTINLFERIDIHAAVGVSKFEIETTASTLISSGTFRNGTLVLDFNTGPAWSAGFNGKLIDWNDWYLGGGFSYFEHYPDLNFVMDNVNSVTHYIDDVDARYYTWMLGIGGGYKAQVTPSFSLSPHMVAVYGPAYFDIDTRTLALDNNTTIELSELYAPYMWGYSLGVTLIGGSTFSLTAQLIRLMATGFYINGTFPF